MIKQLNYAIDARDFINLKSEAKMLFIKLVKLDKLIAIDNYLNENKDKFTDSKEPLSSYEILIEGLNHLIFIIYKNKTVIQINPEIKLDYKVSLESLCKLINDGNLEIKGYNIIMQVFERLG